MKLQKDAHPLPKVEDLLDALHGSRYFSIYVQDIGKLVWLMKSSSKQLLYRHMCYGNLFDFPLGYVVTQPYFREELKLCYLV